jgi:hypothetical protein
VEATGFRLLLDEPRLLERLQEAESDRLVEPGLPLDVSEPERRTFGRQDREDTQRALDRLDAVRASSFRNAVRRSDNEGRYNGSLEWSSDAGGCRRRG